MSEYSKEWTNAEQPSLLKIKNVDDFTYLFIKISAIISRCLEVTKAGKENICRRIKCPFRPVIIWPSIQNNDNISGLFEVTQWLLN